MRSTILSLFVALILAGVAVYGVQTWMARERAQIASAGAVRNEAPKNTIVIANEAIRFGQRLDITMLREIEWSASVRPNGSFSKISDLLTGSDEERARFALTTIEQGEPVLASKVTTPGQRAKLSTSLSDGMKAVSIRVNDVLGVAGFVLPGDRVDILLSRTNRQQGNEETYVDVLLQGVKVIAIDQIADDRKEQPSVVRTVTFEVNTAEAQKLVLAGSVGTLSLALRNAGSSGVEQVERLTLDDLSGTAVSQELLVTAAQAQPDPSAERLEALEMLLKSLSDGVTEQIESVERKINEQKPVIIEKEVVVEKVVERPVVAPVRTTIGVIRNGKRDEYKVDQAVPENPDNS
ncbi:Flp pilus assembly protein CpaB [Roseovarius autotrophicus]|uniref:Flp pilus assembly protein CpaB n=1 Tax=Roseovarius autotrophicus TaxID=2824121 RepID=UPI001B3878F5|nr:Flp pilus assembly protein CpaB [Roseovarius autotrophicus]